MPTMATARRSTGAGRKVKQPVSFDQDASEVSDFVETEADEDSGSDYGLFISLGTHSLNKTSPHRTHL